MPVSYISVLVSVMAAVGIHRLRNYAHVADARLFDGVHHGGEGAKRDIFIGAQIDRLVLRIANLLSRRAPIWLMLMGSLPRKTFCDLSMLITRRSSVISFTVRVWGTLTSIPDCNIGAVTMKIIS